MLLMDIDNEDTYDNDDRSFDALAAQARELVWS